jgi:lysophospholipase L1-like esterase
VISPSAHRGGHPLAGLSANLLLAVASLAVLALVVAAAEWVARRANPRYLERTSLDDLAYLHTYSPAYGWTPRPSFRHTLAGSETTINRLGYRGHEVAPTRTAGRPRIVMLGDSITFGYGVRDGETFSAVMESLDPRLEVVNLGVQGYGTDQELLKLEREGFAYAPDVVVLNVCLANDLQDNAAARSIYDGVYPKPYFRLEDGRLVKVADHVALSAPRRLALLLSQRSALFNALLDLTRVDRARYQRELVGRAAAEPAEPAFAVTFALVRRMDEVTRARGAAFVALLYPSLRDFIRPSRRAQRFLEAPDLRGVKVVDLLPRFEAAGFTVDTFSRYSLDGNLHLTPDGHRLAARVILDVLAEQGLLSPATLPAASPSPAPGPS